MNFLRLIPRHQRSVCCTSSVRPRCQTIRVRLNRSGDRQLNRALYTVVLTRLRTDPVTRAYAERRRAQGKSNREIKRCLVRYVARQLYRLLETQPALDAT
jgi:transposase